MFPFSVLWWLLAILRYPWSTATSIVGAAFSQLAAVRSSWRYLWGRGAAAPSTAFSGSLAEFDHAAELAKMYPDWPHDFRSPPVTACYLMGRLWLLSHEPLLVKLQSELMGAHLTLEGAGFQRVVMRYHPASCPYPHPDTDIEARRHALITSLLYFGAARADLPDIYNEMHTLDWWLAAFAVRHGKRAGPLAFGRLDHIAQQIEVSEEFEPVRKVGRLLVAVARRMGPPPPDPDE